MTGPVQVLVVGFERASFSGEVMAELTRLRDAGIVRLVDLLLVTRTADGSLETIAPPGESDSGVGFGAAAAALFGHTDAPGDPDPVDGAAWSLDDVIPVGSTAAVALIEHLWAAPLRAAIERAGGTPLEETWLASDDVRTLERLTPVGR